MTTAFDPASFQNNAFQIDAVVSGAVPARGGPSRRIHPRYIKEYDPEDELPEVIQRKKKLTKKVEALIAKQPPNTDVVLDPFQTKAELQAAFKAAEDHILAERRKIEDEEDDWLLLIL